MSNGDVIRYNDVRRFGYMTLFGEGDGGASAVQKPGVEPLSEDLSPCIWRNALPARRNR